MPSSSTAAGVPLRHISVRVPWHDSKWNGTVCQRPIENGDCLILKQIRETKDNATEEHRAGRSWLDLAPTSLPACADERGAFMAPFEHMQIREHPYVRTSRTGAHAHFAPTPLRYPAFSALAVPFRWTLRESAAPLAEHFGTPYSQQAEDRADTLMSFRASWVQDRDNQKSLLDRFFGALEPKRSLVFFYAKQTPLSDDPGRTIVGVGRVTEIGPSVDYQYNAEGTLKSMLWQRAVHHSIREAGSDGFLLPYHQLLDLRQHDPSMDLNPFVALSPEEGWEQFSYGSEHVDHDIAIAALLSCERALREAASVARGQWEPHFSWISDRLGELWRMRGPDPGLGSALVAFGMPRGHRIAYELSRFAGENESLWQHMDTVFDDPSILGDELAKDISPTVVKTWKSLPDERRSLIKLLSRFDLTAPQATRYYQPTERQKARIDVTDRAILENPYLLYECDRAAVHGPESEARTVGIETIDRGVFPDEAVQVQHPLPAPSHLNDAVDPRRVRALATAVLEKGASDGSTLLPRDQVVQEIRDWSLTPTCPVGVDLMHHVQESFSPVIRLEEMAGGATAYQLERLATMSDLIRWTVLRRLTGRRFAATADWQARLDKELRGPAKEGDEAEQQARREKVAALAELTASRVAVLIGPAGTGKTTLLSVLAAAPIVANGGVLLLAPTGKARVQLSGRTNLSAQTIAQFLIRRDRYEPTTGAYRRSTAKKENGFKTVVIDEASMLTEDQLGAVLDALEGVERLILVGDPRQLPPIGAGRPFVDIVARLVPDDVESRFPRVGPGYAELTIRRRQAGLSRDDLLLADWFGGGAGDPAADEIWARIEGGKSSDTLRFVSWTDANDLRDKLIDTIVEYLPLANRDDFAGFGQKLGGLPDGKGNVYFNLARGAPEAAERWQILSPVHGQGYGVSDMNRNIQRHFRAGTLGFARSRAGRIPRPLGPDEIVYGDKVIVTRNGARRDVYPAQGGLQYIANGEIGVVVGQFKRQNGPRPWKLEVELSSQPGFAYTVYPSELGDEASPLLELAYAITIHKAQGSEFGTSFLVLPEGCWLLSRELLYTALTRQRDRLVVLHQGPVTALKQYATPSASETARRLTNLFAPPSPIKVDDRFLEEGLIHRTRRGEAVRSKSEVIIADLLETKRLPYQYETAFKGSDGATRYPDFTIEDADTGDTVYWEHLGLLNDPAYRSRWERKLAWYREQGILPHEEGRGSVGTLVVSRDDEKGGIDSGALASLVQEVFGV